MGCCHKSFLHQFGGVQSGHIAVGVAAESEQTVTLHREKHTAHGVDRVLTFKSHVADVTVELFVSYSDLCPGLRASEVGPAVETLGEKSRAALLMTVTLLALR